MKLTERTVKAAKPPTNGRPRLLWDDELRGFGLRVYPSGTRSFVYRYTAPDTRRRRLVVLGEWGALTVHQARTKAERYRGRVLEGEDPAPDRPELGPTVKEFGEIYIRRMEKRWSPKTKYQYERRLANHVTPRIGGRRLEEITRGDVAAIVERVAEKGGPTEANRIHELLRAMFNRAAQWGHYPEDRPNPAKWIERFKETPRERWLKPPEVERLMKAVGKQPDPYFRAFVPLLLMTGMRKSELLRARWEHIDFDRKEIFLPKTKAGKPQVRKLSAPAIEILRFLPREKVRASPGDDGERPDNPHVFPARGTKSKADAHRADFKREWNEVREAAELPDITMHDLRRTAGSYMAQAGVPLAVIADILGHQHPAVTKVYARLSEENERDAVEALGAKLGGLLSAEKEAGASS